MTDPLLASNRSNLKMRIYRRGAECDILRADGTATENRYGKVSDTDQTYSVETQEYFHRIYEEASMRESESQVQGGRINEDDARLASFYNTVAEEGDRVEFPDGTKFALDRRMDFDTHTEWQVTIIQE